MFMILIPEWEVAISVRTEVPNRRKREKRSFIDAGTVLDVSWCQNMNEGNDIGKIFVRGRGESRERENRYLI